MKKMLLLSALVLPLVTFNAEANNQTGKDTAMQVTKQKKDELVKGPAEYFTGDVTIGSNFDSGQYDDYKGAIVNFEAGARTNWHTHPRGQTLVITAGEGRAQTEGEAVNTLKPGDVVWIPAGERHWHGAAPKSKMSHIAVQSPDENGEVVNWMEKVSDEDYLSGE